ncbi:MAG: polysaccharide biosynthesis tyrosine autokinase [Trueperaceae bacterium]
MQPDITSNVGDVLRFIRRGLLLALLVAVTAGVVAFVSSSRLPQTFRSEAVISATRSNNNSDSSTIRPLNDSAYQVAATSNKVIIDTLAEIGVTDPDQQTINKFIEKVRVGIDANANWNDPSSLIRLAVSNSDSATAAQHADILARKLVQWDRDRGKQNFDLQVASLKEQIAGLDTQIRTFQADGRETEAAPLILRRNQFQEQLVVNQALAISPVSALTIINSAIPQLDPVAPRPVFNTALAFLLGLFGSYGILLLRNALDTRLRDIDDLSKISDLPVLASFPKLPNDSRRLPYEATSYLRTNLLFATSDSHPKVIVITSAREAEGKSSVALSLAESFVRNNYRTLLVDADMRKPVIAGEYRINSLHQTSLETWLKNPYGSNQAASVPINGKYYLYVIPSFQPSAQAAELLSSGFRECLEIWRKEYDVIIIDSAPILQVADTLTIAPLATGTLLIANQQKTDRRQVRTAVDILRRIGVRIPGVIATHVNRDNVGQTTSYYGYGYGLPDIDTKQTIIPETVTATKLSKTKR